nr:lysophospholipid acyltransferase 5-like [Onthophagus taurus]
MLNMLVAKLSESVGTPEPALRILISLLLGYPIALYHRKRLYNNAPTSQHLYFIITGFLLGYFNYGFDICHALIAIVFTYLTLTFLGSSSLCVGTVFLFNMGYLLIGYHYSGTNDYDINWTVPQCVLVLRLIAVSYDLYDGRQPIEKLSGDAKKTALAIRPKFLEFCGHQLFPTSFLIGPQFSMRRYQDFVSGQFGDQVGFL